MGIYALRDSDMQHLEFCFYSRIQAAGLMPARSMLACCVTHGA
ncbi:hypothetical protein YSA_08255 [Pseudomonas putida ND6]|uniref:Uncharacterized protein n=1 Tax=Pseudomonas putida ND6 TaxID=231023 RepID=I3V0G3_PSEPU|nr:hypothetical protein YSA_08255 [Pseudomonas putida ND6]